MSLRSSSAKNLIQRVLAATVAVMLACLALPAAAWAEEDPDVFLGAFMDRSYNGTTDYLYVSFDGKTFESLGAPYKPLQDGSDVFAWVGGNAQNTLHDPGLGYHDGVFWLMSGFTIDWNGGWKFIPMFGSSRDLVNWTYPGRPSGVPGTVSPAPDTKGRLGGGAFDCAGPDFMIDDNGDCWIVVPLGYYGDFHGQPFQDFMQPYICKVTGFARGPRNDYGMDDWSRSDPPQGNSGAFTRINLPVYSENWIDPSLYMENGKYYLSIKKDGVQNYIFEIDDLNQAGDSNAWHVVNENVITGYEGPYLTKGTDVFDGKQKYFFYTDRLDSFDHHDGRFFNGIHYQMSESMGEGWGWPQPIVTKDIYGNNIPNRHGSVIRITDPQAKQTILNLRNALGYTRFTDVVGAFGTEPPNTPHVADILWLADEGITTGYPDYTFRGTVPVYRQDMAAFLYRLAGKPEYEVTQEDLDYFSDVDESTPHYKEICWLASADISKGWKEEDGTFTFRGMDTVKRQDMAAFLHRLSNYLLKDASPAGGTFNIFVDVSESTPHYEDIIWLASMGVTTGWDVPTGREFRGMSDVVRQDMAAFLHRMKDNVIDRAEYVPTSEGDDEQMTTQSEAEPVDEQEAAEEPAVESDDSGIDS